MKTVGSGPRVVSLVVQISLPGGLYETLQAIGYGGLLVAFGASIYYARKYVVERRRALMQGVNGAAPSATGRCEFYFL